MFKKLFAVVVTATLMVGSAWAAQVDASNPSAGSGSPWTANADLFNSTGANGGAIGSSASSANVAQINSTSNGAVGIGTGNSGTALTDGVDFTLNVAAGIGTGSGALYMGGKLKILDVTGGLTSGAMTVQDSLTTLKVGGAVSTAALTINGVTQLASFGNTLTATGAAAIGTTTAVAKMEVTGNAIFQNGLTIGASGKPRSTVDFAKNLTLNTAGTGAFVDADVHVGGNAAYFGALNIDGSKYVNDGDVTLATGGAAASGRISTLLSAHLP